MAFIIKDRVKEGTTTTGTGAISLSGAAATFDSFSSYMSNGDTTYYAIVHTSTGVDEWEVGIGTWNTGNTLTRTTVLAGSNGTSAQSFSAGTKDIFMTYPASKAVFTNVNGDIDIDGGTIDGTTIGAVTASSGNFTTGDFTGDVDVDGKIHIGDYVDFDAQSSHPSHREGRLWYDNIHKTLNYHSEDSNVVHELGVEEHARVYNNSGATISKGKPIYFSGSRSASGTHVPTIALANATEESKYKSEGMTASDIPNNAYGYVVIAGLLDGLDTSHLSVGQFFTGITDGATQTMPPVYPNFPMCLGFVVKVDSSEGVVFLAQQNHSIKTFRVQMDQHIGGNLTIDGNLNVTGTTSSTSTSDVTAGAPFYRANEGDAIGEAGTTFTGTGLDDAFFSGHYTGTATITYDVKIDGVGTGTGGVDTFAVSRDGFVTTFSSANDMTGNKQLIHSGDNIYVEFGATTGHTLNDNWEGTASPVNVDSGFWTNRNTGTSGVGYTHMGIWYDASSSKWYLTNEYDPVPSGAIDRSHSSYAKATLDANIEGNVTGNVTGSLTGNATSATALETARTIGGVSFDGSANINLPGVNTAGTQDTSGNADTATALETSRTISLTGDVTGSATFDGSANATITAVVQDDSHSHVISNVDGLQTALDAKTPTARTITSGNGLTGGGNLTANRTLNVGAGGGIIVGADTVSHADTSSQASVNNSSGTVIQDITLDTYGHITGIASTNLDNRFVNVAGDTMTGNLVLSGNGSKNIQIGDGRTDSNYAYIDLVGDTTYTDYGFRFIRGNGGANTSSQILHRGTGNLEISAQDAGTIKHSIAGTERLRTNGSGITVTGNIAVTGTVDGRDVATDGTKLDTIATNANNYSFPYTVSASASNSTVVQRNSSGYIFTNYINTTANDVSSGVTKVMVETGNDNYIRHGSAAAVRSFLNVANGATANVGDITAVTAGTGLSGGGTSGSVTVNLSSTTSPIVATNLGSGTDLNNLVGSQAGFYYQTSNASTSGNNYPNGHAGSLIVQKSAGNATQLYHTYSNSPQLFFRSNYTSGYSAWRKVWHDYNDGSGSGLDADLLDGLHASSFATSAQGTLATNALPKAGGTMTGELQVNARLDVGDGTNTNAEVRIYKADNDISDHIQFYNGTTRVGEIGSQDSSWLRINQVTAKNIYTPRYMRADGGFFVDGTSKGINGSGNFIGGTITGASDANVSNWNTAYTTANAALPKAGGTMTGDLTIPSKIIHAGDTDTYFQFHGANIARIVVANGEVQEWGANYTKLSDNDSLYLGTSNDFRMYFNGTDTIFRNYAHAGGDVFFQGEGSDGVNETTMVQDYSGTRSFVKLYENNAERLRTVSTGVNITGNIGVTGTVDGRNVASDGTKLDGIATGANAYVHPTSAGNKHIPSGGASGQVLGYSSSGTAVWTNPASGGDTIGALQYSGYYDPGTTNSSPGAYLQQIGDLNAWMLVSVDKASYVFTRPADQGGNLTYWKFRKRYRSFS